MTLKRFTLSGPYDFNTPVRDLFQQLFPQLDEADLRYAEDVILDTIRNEIIDRAEPKKSSEEY